MPNWQPNWENVRWNHGAAEAAIAALRRAADMLDHTTADRARVADEAKIEWLGRYREEFDGQLAQILRRAHELANECRTTASQIASASQRAHEEQNRRERERERWRMEKEAEERARKRKQSDRG
jgi:uncharacterized protein YukE